MLMNLWFHNEMQFYVNHIRHPIIIFKNGDKLTLKQEEL
jgi:hypothetical protein